MPETRVVRSDHRVALHVIGANPLLTHALRSILRKAFPKAAFHSSLPPILRPIAGLVFVINAGTIEPLAKTLRAIREKHPKASLIVLGARSANESEVELLSLGASGFVAYHRAERELCDAVRSVAQGRVWMAIEAVEEFERQKCRLATTNGSSRVTNARGLTAREQTILRLMQEGCCNKEIASKIDISVPTVKFHVRNIFAKAGVHDRLRAMEWAKRQAADACHAADSRCAGTFSAKPEHCGTTTRG